MQKYLNSLSNTLTGVPIQNATVRVQNWPAATDATIYGGNTQNALTGVAITGTAGQFSCAATTLAVGQLLTISGTFGGTGSVTGYANPTTYLITATNGTTTFTLALPNGTAIATTAGTPTGLTYSFAFPTSILTTAVDGSFWFYAPNGRYQLVITPPGSAASTITDVILFDEADGSASVSGLQLISTATTGTAPLVVSSTTPVANLIVASAVGRTSSTFTIGAQNCDYTTIQAALTANPIANALFLVYPGTYTNDTVNLTANGQCVIGMGAGKQQVITAASANMCSVGAFTNCFISKITINITAATSAVSAVTCSTGFAEFDECYFNVTNSTVATATQPAICSVSGTGEVDFDGGDLNYTNNVTDGGGATAIKAAFLPGNGKIVCGFISLNISGAGQSLATTTTYTAGSGYTSFNRSDIVITDTATTQVVGYFSAGSGVLATLELDTFTLTGGAAASVIWTFLTGSATLNSSYCDVSCTGGLTNYSGNIGAAATWNSSFDQIIAASGYTGAGTFNFASSPAIGHMRTTSGYLSTGSYTAQYTDGTVVDYATGNGRISVGAADTLSFYNGGIANTLMAQLSTTGLSVTGTITATGGLALTSSSKIPTITATVAANALTVGMTAIPLDFRSTTLGSGTVTTITASPANLVVPSGASLGTVNATLGRIMVLAINNAGTIELAVVNQSGGLNLDETTLVNTTTISGTSNSNNVIYSANARTNVPFRVVGYIEATEATAGTWATAPSLIQGAGGQAGIGQQTLGMGQTWQSVTRTSGTTYYNTTGRPIFLSANFVISAGATGYTISVNGVTVASDTPASGQTNLTMGVPISPGSSYVLTYSGGTPNISAMELR